MEYISPSFSKIIRRRSTHLEGAKINLDRPVTMKAVPSSRISWQMCVQQRYTMLITISLFSCRCKLGSQHVSMRFNSFPPVICRQTSNFRDFVNNSGYFMINLNYSIWIMYNSNKYINKYRIKYFSFTFKLKIFESFKLKMYCKNFLILKKLIFKLKICLEVRNSRNVLWKILNFS